MKRYIKSDHNLYSYDSSYKNDIGEETKVEIVENEYGVTLYYVYYRYSEDDDFRQYGDNYRSLQSARRAAQQAIGLI